MRAAPGRPPKKYSPPLETGVSSGKKSRGRGFERREVEGQGRRQPLPHLGSEKSPCSTNMTTVASSVEQDLVEFRSVFVMPRSGHRSKWGNSNQSKAGCCVQRCQPYSLAPPTVFCYCASPPNTHGHMGIHGRGPPGSRYAPPALLWGSLRLGEPFCCTHVGESDGKEG